MKKQIRETFSILITRESNGMKICDAQGLDVAHLRHIAAQFGDGSIAIMTREEVATHSTVVRRASGLK